MQQKSFRVLLLLVLCLLLPAFANAQGWWHTPGKADVLTTGGIANTLVVKLIKAAAAKGAQDAKQPYSGKWKGVTETMVFSVNHQLRGGARCWRFCSTFSFCPGSRLIWENGPASETKMPPSRRCRNRFRAAVRLPRQEFGRESFSTRFQCCC